MRQTFLIVLLTSTSFLSGLNAKADDNLSLVTWSAFECQMYAHLAENTPESERLFQLGYNSGKEFMRQVFSGELSNDYLRSNAPMGITMLLRDGGPSEEFILGRIYETVTQYAYENAVKKDKTGVTLPPDKWRMDKELQQFYSANIYSDKNCELLK